MNKCKPAIIDISDPITVDGVFYRLFARSPKTQKTDPDQSLPLTLERSKLTFLNLDFCDKIVLTVTLQHPSPDRTKDCSVDLQVDFKTRINNFFPLESFYKISQLR